MKTVFRILKGIVTVFLVVVLFIVVLQKITHNKIAVGNVYIFQVATGSMEPDYKVGDVIVVQKTKAENINVGDDVTYLGKEDNLSGLIITHRVIEKNVYEGKSYFVTKGTANTVQDPEISEDDIFGKVAYHTVLFSFVGRLMTNIFAYYILFIVVGVSFAYEFITAILIKKD